MTATKIFQIVTDLKVHLTAVRDFPSAERDADRRLCKTAQALPLGRSYAQWWATRQPDIKMRSLNIRLRIVFRLSSGYAFFVAFAAGFGAGFFAPFAFSRSANSRSTFALMASVFTL